MMQCRDVLPNSIAVLFQTKFPVISGLLVLNYAEASSVKASGPPPR
jgi:hypothetical protein